MKQFPENQDVVPNGVYQHHKGQYYRVIGIARHSETLEELVVYEALYENKVSSLWIRPKNMFLERVQIAGQEVSRFTYCPGKS